jgi:hypothetical protein
MHTVAWRALEKEVLILSVALRGQELEETQNAPSQLLLYRGSWRGWTYLRTHR